MLGEHADVALGYEQQDALAGVGSPDADVAEAGLVADRDLACFVQAVPSQAVVAGGQHRGLRSRLLTRSVGLRRRAPPDGPVRADSVVVGPEAVELGL